MLSIQLKINARAAINHQAAQADNHSRLFILNPIPEFLVFFARILNKLGINGVSLFLIF